MQPGLQLGSGPSHCPVGWEQPLAWQYLVWIELLYGHMGIYGKLLM